MTKFATKQEMRQELQKVQNELQLVNELITEVCNKLEEIDEKAQQIAFNMPKECNPLIINDMLKVVTNSCSTNWLANSMDAIRNNIYTSLWGMVHAYPEDK